MPTMLQLKDLDVVGLKAAQAGSTRRTAGPDCIVFAVTENRGRGTLPAGDFSAWLRSAHAALAEGESADMPCGECNACCRASHSIHVPPEEKRTRTRLPRELLFPAPGLPPSTLVLGYDQAGRSPILVEARCTVYEDRPLACRTYDCRIRAATGVAPDRDAISGQVRR